MIEIHEHGSFIAKKRAKKLQVLARAQSVTSFGGKGGPFDATDGEPILAESRLCRRCFGR